MVLSDDPRGKTRRAYDLVADEYVRRIAPELESKPFDRGLLDRYAARLAGRTVGDLGCGPGHVARYLRDRSVSMAGFDLSLGLLRRAARMTPDIPFCQADFRRLPVRDGSWAGVLAFYSVLHVGELELVPTLREWRRVLLAGGLLLMATHLGDEDRRITEWWGHEVDLTFRFFRRSDLESAVLAAGFSIEEIQERDPYPEVETQTRRIYLFATNPSNNHSGEQSGKQSGTESCKECSSAEETLSSKEDSVLE